ncbi:hypothetical protein V6N11_002538 [Hibiscus sabdariffa]|uniref:Uncharacterized protein n=1 Tax=Hibiscus sabdariffa TaxID=183260 RepID=A0ABR2SAN6_9ROSI
MYQINLPLRSGTCHHLHKMRDQVLIYLLLACLLLAVSQLQGSQIKVEAIEPGKLLSLFLFISCSQPNVLLVVGCNAFIFLFQCQQFTSSSDLEAPCQGYLCITGLKRRRFINPHLNPTQQAITVHHLDTKKMDATASIGMGRYEVNSEAKMKSFSGLGIGLSLVFGCLVLALFAELYYLLWWKKRIASSEVEYDYTNYAKELVQLLCWKKPSTPLHAPTTANNHRDTNGVEPDLELGSTKGLLLMGGFGEEGVESELMRFHNLAGPPRFLFTIKEETKDDLESEDKGSRRRNLNDVMLAMDTPFHSPLSSPPLKSPLGSYYQPQGFNPLFESSTDGELNKLRSSPPPKFKFLRDAEEKLLKRLMLEAEKRVQRNGGSFQDSGVKAVNGATISTEGTMIEGSFLKFIVDKSREPLQYLPQYPSSSSQVLPLASSPITFRPPDKDCMH